MDNTILLTESEKDRYSRQIMVDSFGYTAQQKLKYSKVLLIGIGGIGAPAGQLLASMGVGELCLVDDDYIELSNLPRQILFGTNDIGKSKVYTAKQKLTQLNENIKITTLHNRIDNENEHLFAIGDYDYILDTSDNFTTKSLLNRLSIRYKVPLLSVSVANMSYQVALFNQQPQSPCLSCIYPSIRSADLVSCSNSGVLGFVTSQSATMAVNLIINAITTGNCDERLFCYDAQTLELNGYNLSKNSICKVCNHV